MKIRLSRKLKDLKYIFSLLKLAARCKTSRRPIERWVYSYFHRLEAGLKSAQKEKKNWATWSRMRTGRGGLRTWPDVGSPGPMFSLNFFSK